MMDYVQWPPGYQVNEVPGHAGFQGFGDYEEEYVRGATGWLIAYLRLSRIRFDPLPVGHSPPIPGRFQLRHVWI